MAHRALAVFSLGLITAIFAAPALSRPVLATPQSVCQVAVDKTARPTSVVLGDEVEIALSIRATCPAGGTNGGPADIVLALDRSASMGDNGHWRPAVDAAAGFVELIDFSLHQVGIVTFSGGIPLLQPDGEVNQTLSADKAQVAATLRGIPAPQTYTGPTNLTAALRYVQGEFGTERHRPEARPVLVLLTDGEHNATGVRSPIDEAADAKAAGTQIVTIGLGTTTVAADQLRQIASDPSLFFESPTDTQLKDVYTAVAGAITAGGGIADLEITDILTPDVEYVAGSAVPAPSSVTAGELKWTTPGLPPGGWVARYRVRPLHAGTFATNKLAYVDFLDADGTVASATFPQPVIKVREPGENGIFLPILMREHCPPQRPFDVALVVDTSSSMDGAKLAQTRLAARDFLDILTMPPSRASIVVFNANATVVAPLTTDRTRANLALDNLPRGEGTRIDKALDAARGALTGADADANHAKVIVLLTDGRQVGEPEQTAINAAASARRAGITVFTIGVGPDAAEDFLIRVAGDPSRYYKAADETGLLKIYRAIAGTLPCTIR
jgi:Mg-chelatase subunit ChlD